MQLGFLVPLHIYIKWSQISIFFITFGPTHWYPMFTNTYVFNSYFPYILNITLLELVHII